MNFVTIILAASNVFTLAALIINSRKQGQQPVIDWTGVPGGKPAGLDPNFAKSLVGNYKNNQWRNINNSQFALPEVDSRSVWFDLNTLKNFIYDIETTTFQNCSLSVANSVQLGIRIYFGAYGNANDVTAAYTSSGKSLPAGVTASQYAYKHTLLMVPTYRDMNIANDTDFDPNYFNSDGSPVSMLALCSIPANGQILPSPDMSITNQKVLMLNHGSMVPPPFDPPSYSQAAYMLNV